MSQQNSKLSVILHGGAGNFNPNYTPKKLPFLRKALDAAWEKLCQGAAGHLAVCAALQVMEECQYFNAGYGAFPNIDGKVFLDIGLMSGKRDFISFLNISRIRYPSQLALDSFQEGKKLMTVWTPGWSGKINAKDVRTKERYGLVQSDAECIAPVVREILNLSSDIELAEERHGTIGCVVKDSFGEIYAGTSTGGLGGKSDGRVGDSPIIGSGVFADNELCGLSTSGHGEEILASSISGFVISKLRPLQSSGSAATSHEIGALGAIIKEEMLEFRRKFPSKDCGMIVVAKDGQSAYDFCSSMFALARRSGSKQQISQEEVLIARNGEQALRY